MCRTFWGDQKFMAVDTGGVMMLSKSQEDVMEELAITMIGMDGIPLSTREMVVARMPSKIERQTVSAVEEAVVIIFVVDGQIMGDYEEEEENQVPSIPHVGKSSILNALVGEDRTIVSLISGTTRDAIDTEFTSPDGQVFSIY